jgi:hypothetical protein
MTVQTEQARGRHNVRRECASMSHIAQVSPKISNKTVSGCLSFMGEKWQRAD